MLGLFHEQLNDREALDELKRHPAIVVRMLRVTNFSASGTRPELSSLNDALRVLGHRQVQRIVNVLPFAGDGSEALTRNPLFQLACSRGKLVELLADADPDATLEENDGAFLVGVLSLIEGLLSQRMHLEVRELGLRASLTDAILLRKGHLGKLLVLVEALEIGDDAVVARSTRGLGYLSEQEFMRAQVDAFAWAGAVSN